METNSLQDFKLRYSIQPYVGIVVIISVVDVFMLWGFLVGHDDISVVWGALAMWVTFSYPRNSCTFKISMPYSSFPRVNIKNSRPAISWFVTDLRF